MRIALVQLTTGRDIEANLELVREGIRDAVLRSGRAGVDVVVFPEASMRAFGNSLVDIAEPLDGPWASAVRAAADEAGVVVVAGMFTPGEPGTVRNTLLVHGRGVDTHYDKIHLYDAFGFKESDTVTAGASPVRFTLDGVTFGLATCYDVRFPALFTANAVEGAHVHLVCASWAAGRGKAEQWDLLVRARAADTTSYVLACGQSEPSAAGVEARPGAPTGIGRSAVVGPYGNLIERAGNGPQILYADVDTAVVDDARRALPLLANRVSL